MTMFSDEFGQFKVVWNGRRQMSIWPADRPNPAGWDDTGFTGSKESCLAHIEEEWHDLRPADVRRDPGSRPAQGH
jgi:MbtH protein